MPGRRTARGYPARETRMSTPPQPNPTPPAPPNPAPPTPPAPPVPPVPGPPNPAAPPAVPPTPPVPAATDWQAEARKWEDRAKANSKAAEELATVKAAAMTDQERAVEAARTEGRTAAATDYGQQLADARFEAAAATAGLQLGPAAALIDKRGFLNTDGSINTDAITAAITTLKTLAPPVAGRSGGDGFGGGEGPLDIDKQIETATAKGDWQAVVALKRAKSAQTT